MVNRGGVAIAVMMMMMHGGCSVLNKCKALRRLTVVEDGLKMGVKKSLSVIVVSFVFILIFVFRFLNPSFSNTPA